MSTDAWTVSAAPMRQPSAVDILDSLQLCQKRIELFERTYDATLTLREIDFWGHGMRLARVAEWTKLLVRELRGREAVFISERHLEPGRVMWITTLLPRVFVAPDVFAAIEKVAT